MSGYGKDGLDERWFYVTENVTADELTIDFFLEHAAVAKEKGFDRWGTRTEKSTDPWTVRLLFWKRDL